MDPDMINYMILRIDVKKIPPEVLGQGGHVTAFRNWDNKAISIFLIKGTPPKIRRRLLFV